MRAESIVELMGLSDEEVIRRHDELARATVVGTSHYLEELRHRRAARVSEEIQRFTKWIAFMTVAITVATVVNVVIAGFLIFG